MFGFENHRRRKRKKSSQKMIKEVKRVSHLSPGASRGKGTGTTGKQFLPITE